jgi:hypothetical protein
MTLVPPNLQKDPVIVFEEVMEGFVLRRKLRGPSDIVTDVVRLVRAVEQYTHLSGLQKKEAVVGVLQTWASKIADEDDPEESATKLMLEQSLTSVIPLLIDGLIEVDKNGIKIRKKIWGFLPSCCSKHKSTG